MGHFQLPPTPLGLGETLLSDMNYNQSFPALKRKYPDGPPRKTKCSERGKLKKEKKKVLVLVITSNFPYPVSYFSNSTSEILT